MAGGVGNAYLNVVPKVDNGKAKSAGAQAGNAISSGLNSAISAQAVALGNVISSAVMGGVDKIGGELKKSFTNYMDFEQLSGGAQKIFDEIDYSKIQKDAAAAFHDLNLSANEYLESINSVGATFAQTMGDQKGYDTARKGMLAVSDYASGTGKSIDELNEKYQMITRSTGSYQSIADQFSGILPATSADFLEQAQAAGLLSDEYEKLTDVPVAEYQQAVTDMLEKGVDALNLTNNTANEATETLSGSFASVSSAWENLLTELGDGGQNFDMTATVDALISSLGDAISLSAERVGVIGETLGNLIVDAIPDDIMSGFTATFDTSGFESAASNLKGIADEIGGVFDRLSEGAGGGIGEAIGTVATAIGTLSQAFSETFDPEPFESAMIHVKGTLEDLSGFISENMPNIGEVLGTAFGVVANVFGTLADVISTVLDVFGPFIPAIAGAAAALGGFSIISGIVGSITAFVSTVGAAIGMIGSFSGAIAVVTTLLGGPIPIIVGLVGAIVGFIATNEDARNKVLEVWNSIKEAVSNAVSAAVEFVSTKFGELKATVPAIMNGVKDSIGNAWNNIKTSVGNAVSSVVGTVKNKFGNIVGSVRNTFNKVKDAITSPINAARDAIKGAIDRIKGIVNGAHLSLPHFALPHFNINGGKLPWGIGGKGTPPSISVSWSAKGGYFDEPTLFAGVGERGGEFVWPSYAPYLDRYADALASRMGGTGGVNVYLTYNGSGDADELVSTLTRELRMLKATGAI